MEKNSIASIQKILTTDLKDLNMLLENIIQYVKDINSLQIDSEINIFSIEIPEKFS